MFLCGTVAIALLFILLHVVDEAGRMMGDDELYTGNEFTVFVIV